MLRRLLPILRLSTLIFAIRTSLDTESTHLGCAILVVLPDCLLDRLPECSLDHFPHFPSCSDCVLLPQQFLTQNIVVCTQGVVFRTRGLQRSQDERQERDGYRLNYTPIIVAAAAAAVVVLSVIILFLLRPYIQSCVAMANLVPL